MARPHSVKESLPGLWRIARYFWPQLGRYRWLICGSICALLLEVSLRLVEPWPLKVVFDSVLGFSSRPNGKASLHWEQTDPDTLLGLAAIAVVAVTSLRAVASYWSTVGFAQVGNRILIKVRNQLYRHLQYLSLSFHTKARTGDLVLRVIHDVSMLQDVAVTALLPMMVKGLIMVGMVSLMFWLQWQLALVSLAVLPLFWLRTARLNRRIRQVAQKQRQRQGAMAAKAAESISGIRTVQALSMEGIVARAFSTESEKSLKEDVKGKRLAAQLERSVDVLVAAAVALVVWFGTHLVLKGNLTAGELLVFLVYLKYCYRPLQDFAKYNGRLAKASAAGERVLELLERVPDVRDLPGATIAPSFRGHVVFDNLSFHYDRGQRLLQDISLEAAPGERIALVGPSGGGKSTMVSLLLRLYDPEKGAVCVDGSDIRHYTLESLRSQISVVLQDNLLFASTIRENLLCAAPGASDEQMESAARRANAHEFISALPQGYLTLVGERGVTLSHGQRQRISIARAALRNAPILILDEPTTGLDPESQCAVMEALVRLYHGRTSFIITHDLHQAVNADLILYLDKGRIVERGPHMQLLKAGGPYAELFHSKYISKTPEPLTNDNALAR